MDRFVVLVNKMRRAQIKAKAERTRSANRAQAEAEAKVDKWLDRHYKERVIAQALNLFPEDRGM